MKSSCLKIFSTFLAFLVLFSTLSFTVESHYCGDFLVNTSFTGHATNCGMKMSQKTATNQKSCCTDVIIKTKGQDELHQLPFQQIDFEKAQFLPIFLFSYEVLFHDNPPKEQIYKQAPPTNIPINYQILYQSFLI
ncbi:HYC_CC_PP family protein [Polaribacter irgensii]|nr:hypothetical protein [Polaribacter irgensii]